MSSETTGKRLDNSGRTVGISISDSEDLGQLGLDPLVVDLAYTEISRHLLAHGANLAYGGDHRYGGFGGCTRDLIDALGGARPERLTREYQCDRSEHHADYAPLYEEYNRRHPDAPIDYDALCKRFAQTGVAGLRDGLDEAENRILFETEDVDEMIALLLKGLSRAG